MSYPDEYPYGAVKYIIEHQDEPTPLNIYAAGAGPVRFPGYCGVCKLLRRYPHVCEPCEDEPTRPDGVPIQQWRRLMSAMEAVPGAQREFFLDAVAELVKSINA